MKKIISTGFLSIVFILLILTTFGIIQSAQFQNFGLLSIVVVLWGFCCWINLSKPTWSWFGVLLFVLSWAVYPLMPFISKFVLPWSADTFLLSIDQLLWNGKTLSAYFHYEDYPYFADIISICYFFFYFLSLGSVIFYTIKRKDMSGSVFFNGVILIYFIGFIGYILLPAAGPAFTILPQYSGGGPMTQMITRTVNQGVTGMDVFPSLHTAISIFIVGFFRKTGHKKLSLCLIPIVSGTIFATIFLRYHYGIDLLCGIALGLFVLKMSQCWLQEQQIHQQ